MDFISKSVEETAQIASNFAKATLDKSNFASSATVVGLYGDLGSGKTTFMKYLAESFGIKETIQSPTFVIMKSFNLQSSMFNYPLHISVAGSFAIFRYELVNILAIRILSSRRLMTSL